MLIHLASQSPRRRELLTQIGVPYKVVKVDVPEIIEPGELAEKYVSRLAKLKAMAGLALAPEGTSLGADTIVCCDGDILEKPSSYDDLERMLSVLSARTHQVMTAVFICNRHKQRAALSISTVRFKKISVAQMARYWDSGEPQDKAGGYGIQGLGAVFVERIEGSYSGIVGLPIELVSEMLPDFDVPQWEHIKI